LPVRKYASRYRQTRSPVAKHIYRTHESAQVCRHAAIVVAGRFLAYMRMRAMRDTSTRFSGKEHIMGDPIGSIHGNNAMIVQGMRDMKRPNPTQASDNLLSKLDFSGPGYIQKSDLQAVFSKSSSPSSSAGMTSSVDDLFSQLDTNGDGKVTKQEFADSLKKIAEQLEIQLVSMCTNCGMPRDGKASFKDTMAYEESALSTASLSAPSSTSSSTSTNATSSTSKTSKDAKTLMQILRLMQVYNQWRRQGQLQGGDGP
jgi:EF hand.